MKFTLKIILALIFLTSCGGGDDNSNPKEGTKKLGEFTLLFPENNQICTEGTSLENDKVSINFLWTTPENANSYELKIIDQETNDVVTFISSQPEKDVTLSRGIQYTWTVTAILDEKTQKESTAWNFYSEGISVENYAPFPAEIIITDNTDGTAKIEWSSIDLDDDISNYDVYFDVKQEPEILLKDTDLTSISSQAIEYGTVYYIKIVTKDKRGNSSVSSRSFRF